MKYSLRILKNKNLFKRLKYPSPNALNIKYFWHSATIIGGFRVSRNYPILNFKKTVCPKNVWMRHWRQKRICWIVGPSLAASLEPLAHRRNVASLSLFYRYYFGRCSSELAQLVPLPYSRGRSNLYSDRLHDFSVTIPRCYKDLYVNSFFTCIARPWNFLSIKCFPLTYDLNGFKSRIHRHLLTVGSF